MRACVWRVDTYMYMYNGPKNTHTHTTRTHIYHPKAYIYSTFSSIIGVLLLNEKTLYQNTSNAVNYSNVHEVSNFSIVLFLTTYVYTYMYYNIIFI